MQEQGQKGKRDYGEKSGGPNRESEGRRGSIREAEAY
jgi:hypothetical protein